MALGQSDEYLEARYDAAMKEVGGTMKIYVPTPITTEAEAEATQTVFHLHVHLVPRRAEDGLHLPWTGQKA